MTSTPTVSVLMPVYNEEATLETILSSVLNIDIFSEVILVDDASTDRSFAIAESFHHPKLRVFRQETNQGKTAAINRALSHATSDIVVIQDADLEYDPEELRDVLDPIFTGKADVVYGSRFLVKKASRVLYFYHYIGNCVLTFLSNFFTNLNMTDIETCYKAMKTSMIKPIGLTSRGFGMEVEITALVSKCNVRIYEVPISYYGRTYDEGKKVRFTDGLWALYYILYYNLIYPHLGKVRDHIQKVSRRPEQ